MTSSRRLPAPAAATAVQPATPAATGRDAR